MKNRKILISSFLAVLLLFVSCSKQSAPTIESSEVRTQNEIDRLEACSAVNLNTGVLLHYNIVLLFKCTKWNEEFPSMFNAIKTVRSSSWDHLMAPIDKEFIENINRRDKFFQNIKDLDAKNGLDDLSRVLVALNETNFFDSVKEMLGCVENNTVEYCQVRSFIPTKRSLKNIIKIVESDPQTIDLGSNLIKHLNQAMAGKEDAIRAEINKFKNDPLYIEIRLKIIDAIAKKLQGPIADEDRVFISKLLLTGNARKDAPWIYSWLNDTQMSREVFKDLVEYPVLINPELVAEYQGLKNAYNDNFVCSIRSTTVNNDLVNFDFKNHLFDHLTIFNKRDYRGYMEYAASLVVGLKASVEVCEQLETNKYGFSFLKMMNNQSQFLGQRKFYDLFKFILSFTTIKGDEGGNFSSNLYFFDLIASEIFGNVNNLNSIIVSRTREFYPVLYDVIQKLPEDAFIDLGEFTQKIASKENDSKVKGIADFWTFFNATEKNFLFNFVDRHFDDETQFLVLFEFYSKFLDDLKEVAPVFAEKWSSDEEKEEMSYQTLQDLFTQLAGKETLIDFKKFFGRDQILKVLEVISNGANINAKAKEELAYLRNEQYLARLRKEPYDFKVVYTPSSNVNFDARPLLECMQKFSDIENGFYLLVKKLPEACKDVSESYMAFRAFSWLNAIDSGYMAMFPNKNDDESILSPNGLLSPYILNTVIGNSKILDNLIGELGSKIPTKNGIKYLGESAKYYLIDKKADQLLEQNLEWLNKWTSVLPEKNIVYRNLVLKDFSRESNFSHANIVSNDVSTLMSNYADWVRSGKKLSAELRSFGQPDPNFDCKKVINQKVAPHPCPTKEVVKLHTNSIVKYLTTIWEKDQGSAIAQLLKAVKPGSGLDIPLNGKKTSKYRLTLKETIKYLYDTSDKSLPVNNVMTSFTNENNQTFMENLTTLERVEVVIREVRFDNNYLGVSFLNAITQSDNYNKEVDNRKKLLATCLKIPGIRCSKPMSDSDLRMAKNALETFDSLSDVNNGRGKEAKLNYGNFLKTFEQTLVASSAKEAQEVKLLPLKDELLLKHNGRLLGHMTMMTMWSNTARYIRDRVGRTPKEFNSFIEGDALNRVSQSLLLGFDLPSAGPSAERLLIKIQKIQSSEKQSMLDQTIDWVSSLDYAQTRLLEDTVARALLAASYLGSPDVVFGVASKEERYNRYKENNILQLFLALEEIVDYYPILKNYFPKDAKLIEAIKPLNTFLVFLTDSLGTTKVPKKNIAYLVLNDVFDGLNTVMFKDYVVPTTNNSVATIEGLDFLLGFLSNPKNVTDTYELIKNDYQFAGILHENQANWFRVFGQNLKRITEKKELVLVPIRDYISYTTKASVCQGPRGTCKPNYHYDEPTNILKYLISKNKKGESNLKIATKKVLVENFDQLNAMINDLLPAIRIQSVQPPLSFN